MSNFTNHVLIETFCLSQFPAYYNPLLTAICLFRNFSIDEGVAEAAVDEHPSPLLSAAPEDPGRRRAASEGADGVDRQRQRPRHRRAKAGGVQLGGLLLGLRPRGGGGTPGELFYNVAHLVG